MILAVIPARYASQRLPGKPLIEIQGKTMIRRVMEQTQKARRVSKVIVATDDERIVSEVEKFGGNAEMTALTHVSGTERVAEIAERYPQYDYVLNIQGDEPFIDPRNIDQLCEILTEPGVELATLMKRIEDPTLLNNPNIMKIVTSVDGYAMYFSRSPIPFCRDEVDMKLWTHRHSYYKHICIYGFSREMLLRIPGLSPSPLEQTESLEQLRWLAHGYRIRIAETPYDSYSVDTAEDLNRFSPQN